MIVKGRVPLVDGSSSPASCLVAGVVGVVNLLLDDSVHFCQNSVRQGQCTGNGPLFCTDKASIILAKNIHNM